MIRWLFRDAVVRYILACLLLAGVVVAVGVFAVDAGDSRPEPVSFDQTTTIGLPAEDRQTLSVRNLSIPSVQVFYSQYPYVVGYEGVERAVQTLQQPKHTQQFGFPLTVYVSDYAGTDLELTADGYLRTDREPGWVSANDASFVVGSEARTTTGETVVPFRSRSAADRFSDTYGGDVVTWSQLRSYTFDLDDATAVRARVDAQHRTADERAAALSASLERDTAVVVGEDAPTVQAAVDAAPPNSTVVVPAGRYEEHVTVDRPITLRGANATIQGNGTGRVLEITHPNVTVTGLQITGVGDRTRPEDAFDDGDGWDQRIDAAYGRGDAGIFAINASGLYIADVTIETPTTGVLLRDSPDSVIQGLTVNGTDRPMEGFMGILSIRSPVVVQQSTIDGGRDGVYLHRAHESILRNNTFDGNRFGVHLMYTSDTLIADNVARHQALASITIMTNPSRNAVVGNDIRDAREGIALSGSRSYVADNVVANNDRGILAGTTQTLYERNVIYGNAIGMRSDSILPSNQVQRNDFVANDVHAQAGIGPLRIWTGSSGGNYWQGAHGLPLGTTLDRSYSPTDPVESQFHLVDGTVTLAESPGARALAAIRATSPGLRRGNVVDSAPLAVPVHPEIVSALESDSNATFRGRKVEGENDDR